MEGRLPETVLKGGAGSGVPRCGANRNDGRSGPRPPGLLAWRGQSLRLRFHCREPASWVRIRKPPRWSKFRTSMEPCRASWIAETVGASQLLPWWSMVVHANVLRSSGHCWDTRRRPRQMPKPRATRLETATARRRLEVRNKPFCTTISPASTWAIGATPAGHVECTQYQQPRCRLDQAHRAGRRF